MRKFDVHSQGNAKVLTGNTKIYNKLKNLSICGNSTEVVLTNSRYGVLAHIKLELRETFFLFWYHLQFTVDKF